MSTDNNSSANSVRRKSRLPLIAIAAGAALLLAYQFDSEITYLIDPPKESSRIKMTEAVLNEMPPEFSAAARPCAGCHSLYEDKMVHPSLYLIAQRYKALGAEGAKKAYADNFVGMKNRTTGNYFFDNNEGKKDFVIAERTPLSCSFYGFSKKELNQKFFDWLTTYKFDDDKYTKEPLMGYIANGEYSKLNDKKVSHLPKYR